MGGGGGLADGLPAVVGAEAGGGAGDLTQIFDRSRPAGAGTEDVYILRNDTGS